MSHVDSLSGVCLIGLSLIGFPGLAGAQEISWRADFNETRRLAGERQLPVLLDFGNEQCIWCKRLDATTFRDPAVIRLVQERFLAVKVDTNREMRLTQSLGVETLPTLIVLSPEGKVLARQAGYLDRDAMLQFLNRALPAQTVPEVRRVEPGYRMNIYPPPVVEDRGGLAKRLLQQATKDREDQRYLACLDRCEAILVAFPDLPEAVSARQLMVLLASDGTILDRLREQTIALSLVRAGELERQGDLLQAKRCLEQVQALLATTDPRLTDIHRRLLALRSGSP